MKETKIYVHSSKESMYDKGEQLGLNEKQLQEFIYTAYEVEIGIQVDEDGIAWATHLQGVPLETRVRI